MAEANIFIKFGGTNSKNSISAAFLAKNRGTNAVYAHGYILIEFIGIGGFGIVFKAKHKHLNKIKAIKLSHPIDDDLSILKDLISSAITPLINLNHPNIVKVDDVGLLDKDSQKRMFIIMDLINGDNFRNYLNHEKKDVNQIIKIVLAVCETIEYCHNFEYFQKSGAKVIGIQHGDLKPENILLDSSLRPILCDFMLVDLQKIYELNIMQPSFFYYNDMASCAMGTPGYMAPEQSEKGMITEKSDIYSIGVILLESFSNIVVDKTTGIYFKDENEVKELLNDNSIPQELIKLIYEATIFDKDKRVISISEMIEKLKASSQQ